MSQDLYRIRDFVSDFDTIAAEFADRSRALSERVTMRRDIAYGKSARETLDVILPPRPTSNMPLHVFVHGGYWRSGEKANYRFVAAPVLAAGGVAALVEYDLMPGQRLSVLVDQIRRAVRWLQLHAGEFGADPGRMTVSGHSAGAHLASFLAATGLDETDVPALPIVRGMLLVSGIYDLSGIPDSFLRHEAEMTSEEAASWSPLSSKPTPCPQRIIAYGGDETEPFRRQGALLHQKLMRMGEPTQTLVANGLNHMSVVLDLADINGTLGRQLGDLVASS